MNTDTTKPATALTAEQVRTAPLLYQSAITRQRETVALTHPDHRAPQEAELAALEARWEAEAPVREAREILRREGVVLIRDDRRGPIWRRKSGRWIDVSDAEADEILARSR